MIRSAACLLAIAMFTAATPLGADPVRHLAAAVRFPTISHQSGAPAEVVAASERAFSEFRTFLEQTYPLVFERTDAEWVNRYSLLIKWHGSDPTLHPAMFTAHSDVVPVEPGTESDWTHPPFAGVVANGIIYGRGTLDDKLGVIGWLEALEAALKQGVVPKRSVYFGFGHDEEIGGKRGAGAIAALLRERGVRLAYLIDEGGFIVEDHPLLKDRAVASVNVAEKGYLTLHFEVTGEGGHSSMPPANSTIATMAEAMVKIQNHPFPARLVEPVKIGLEAIAPYSPGLVGLMMGNLWLSETFVLREMEKSRSTNALVRTTTALTQFNAGVKENVVPQSARATVNFRLLPGDTPELIIERIKRIIDNPDISVTGGSWEQPPAPGSLDGIGYRHLVGALEAVYPDVVVMPSLVSGATDTRHYVGLADDMYRFHAMTMSMDQTTGVHGSDERLSVASFRGMVAFNERLLLTAAGVITDPGDED